MWMCEHDPTRVGSEADFRPLAPGGRALRRLPECGFGGPVR